MCLRDWGQCYKDSIASKAIYIFFIHEEELLKYTDYAKLLLSDFEREKKRNQLVFNEEKATLCDGAVPCSRPVQLVIFGLCDMKSSLCKHHYLFYLSLF